MLKKFKSLKVFLIIPALVLLGFFACVVHILPQPHHVTDSHAEHNTNQVSCVDHQGVVYLSHKDHSEFIQVALLPNTRIEPIFVTNIDFNYSNWTEIYSPPNKTPLYLKHNTFLI